jgi:hypothetical protein
MLPLEIPGSVSVSTRFFPTGIFGTTSFSLHFVYNLTTMRQ